MTMTVTPSNYAQAFDVIIEKPFNMLLALLEKGHFQAAVDVAPMFKENLTAYKDYLQKQHDLTTKTISPAIGLPSTANLDATIKTI